MGLFLLFFHHRLLHWHSRYWVLWPVVLIPLDNLEHLLHYLFLGLFILVNRDHIEKILKRHNILMGFLKLFGVSTWATEQRTALTDLAQLVFKTYQVVFQVINLVLNFLWPVWSYLRQAPVQLLKCPQVIFSLILRYILLVWQFTD